MAGETTLTINGNLTNDPELRFTPSGDAVANFTIASTPRTYDSQSKQWKDGETLFMRVAAWRSLGENIAETFTKGMGVIIQGKLKSRSYETKEGEKRTVIEMEAENAGPSLQWAIAQVKKVNRSNNQGGQQGNRGNQGGGFGGNQGGGFGGQQGGQADNTGGNGYSQQDDPWATPGVSNSGGWGNGPDSEPPF